MQSGSSRRVAAGGPLGGLSFRRRLQLRGQALLEGDARPGVCDCVGWGWGGVMGTVRYGYGVRGTEYGVRSTGYGVRVRVRGTGHGARTSILGHLHPPPASRLRQLPSVSLRTTQPWGHTARKEEREGEEEKEKKAAGPRPWLLTSARGVRLRCPRQRAPRGLETQPVV
jgi:hypothetical protein